ncbi:hypothetical protein G6F32_014022 [Rhizopus arrhizus]|nr:hypothetical protein G6F32_014022 [Rhizopus arrhizus]
MTRPSSSERGTQAIGFVPDAADHGDLAGGHLARQVFVVEAPEIFDAAPAANQQEGIDFGALVGHADLGRPAAGCVRALNRGRIDNDRHLRRAPGQRRQHIAQRGRAPACGPDRTGPQRPIALSGAEMLHTGCPARPGAWRRPAAASRRGPRTGTPWPGFRPDRQPGARNRPRWRGCGT